MSKTAYDYNPEEAQRTCNECGEKIHQEIGAYNNTIWADVSDQTDDAYFCNGVYNGHYPVPEVELLAEGAKTADDRASDQPVDTDQAGTGESTVTDYDTKDDQDPMWAEDWDGEDDTGSQIGSEVQSEYPGAEGSNVDPEPAFDGEDASFTAKVAEKVYEWGPVEVKVSPATETSLDGYDVVCHACGGVVSSSTMLSLAKEYAREHVKYFEDNYGTHNWPGVDVNASITQVEAYWGRMAAGQPAGAPSFRAVSYLTTAAFGPFVVVNTDTEEVLAGPFDSQDEASQAMLAAGEGFPDFEVPLAVAIDDDQWRRASKRAAAPWMPMVGDRVKVNGKPGEVVGKSGNGRYDVKMDDGWVSKDISRDDLSKASRKTADRDNTYNHVKSAVDNLQEGYATSPVTAGPRITLQDGQYWVDPTGVPWIDGTPVGQGPMSKEEAINLATDLIEAGRNRNATRKTADQKRTDELVPGDKLLIDGRIVRTVDRVEDAGYIGMGGDPVFNVMYQEGASDGWGPGNSGVAHTLWTLASRSKMAGAWEDLGGEWYREEEGYGAIVFEDGGIFYWAVAKGNAEPVQEGAAVSLGEAKEKAGVALANAAWKLSTRKTAADIVTCGTCGLSWDDSIPTSMTPAPSGRCPFEYFHEYHPDDPDFYNYLEPEDIPDDFEVRPYIIGSGPYLGSKQALIPSGETYPCASCGKPATHFAFQDGAHASGFFACEDHIDNFSEGRTVEKIAANQIDDSTRSFTLNPFDQFGHENENWIGNFTDRAIDEMEAFWASEEGQNAQPNIPGYADSTLQLIRSEKARRRTGSRKTANWDTDETMTWAANTESWYWALKDARSEDDVETIIRELASSEEYFRVDLDEVDWREVWDDVRELHSEGKRHAKTGANEDYFDSPADAKEWATIQLSQVWGSEWDVLPSKYKPYVVQDLLDSDRTAQEIKTDVFAGNLDSYARTLAAQFREWFESKKRQAYAPGDTDALIGGWIVTLEDGYKIWTKDQTDAIVYEMEGAEVQPFSGTADEMRQIVDMRTSNRKKAAVTEVARWESNNGRYYVSLEEFSSGGYGYDAEGAGGNLAANDFDSAVAELESKIQTGYFLPDAYKTQMKRVATKRTANQEGPIGEGSNGYVAFYKGRELAVYADSSYRAQEAAAEFFKAKKSYEVTVVLAEKGGEQVTHNPAMFGSKKANEQSGHGESSLPDVEVTDDHADEEPMWPWEIEGAKTAKTAGIPDVDFDIGRSKQLSKGVGEDAADVADVPTPGQEVDDYPQPPIVNIEALKLFRSRIAATSPAGFSVGDKVFYPGEKPGYGWLGHVEEVDDTAILVRWDGDGPEPYQTSWIVEDDLIATPNAQYARKQAALPDCEVCGKPQTPSSYCVVSDGEHYEYETDYDPIGAFSRKQAEFVDSLLIPGDAPFGIQPGFENQTYKAYKYQGGEPKNWAVVTDPDDLDNGWMEDGVTMKEAFEDANRWNANPSLAPDNSQFHLDPGENIGDALRGF